MVRTAVELLRLVWHHVVEYVVFVWAYSWSTLQSTVFNHLLLSNCMLKWFLSKLVFGLPICGQWQLTVVLWIDVSHSSFTGSHFVSWKNHSCLEWTYFSCNLFRLTQWICEIWLHIVNALRINFCFRPVSFALWRRHTRGSTEKCVLAIPNQFLTKPCVESFSNRIRLDFWCRQPPVCLPLSFSWRFKPTASCQTQGEGVVYLSKFRRWWRIIRKRHEHRANELR